MPGLSGTELMDVFDAGGVRVSAGSACSSAEAAPSSVLQAVGVPQSQTRYEFFGPASSLD